MNFFETPVIYVPNFVARTDADLFYKYLWNDLDWVRHDKVPRREYYTSAQGLDYTYGLEKYARTYKSQPMHMAIEWLILKLSAMESNKAFVYDTVFLNGYEDASDSLGWHSDNSPEMDDNYPIAIVSFGAERDIWFREISGVERDVNAPVAKLNLGHGSLCLMKAGMQDTHQHRIPKCDRLCGPRISLTFRMYTEPGLADVP